MRLLQKTLTLLLCALLTAGCSETGGASAPPEDKETRLSVVATLFPQYDFARRVGGEHADVAMLLAPGVESHSFDPTPADLVKIGQSDLFLYTGDEMEPWARKLAESGDAKGARIVDLSAGIPLLEPAEDEHEAHGEASGHHHAVDPHIWTSPDNAIHMVETIAAAFAEADPAHAADYTANAESAVAELRSLDDELFAIVK
ncbi:MAG: zinc ABC transporter substrate-binding protein, partial [Oscillospiraceae bacterium]